MAWVSCLRDCLLQQAETELDAIIRLERLAEQARQKNVLLSELFNNFNFFRHWAVLSSAGRISEGANKIIDYEDQGFAEDHSRK